MRDLYKYNHSELPGTATQGQDFDVKAGREPRIPMALRNLENQSGCLHDAISRLADRLHPISRSSAPGEAGCEARMEPACEVEGFISRQADSLVIASQRINDLLERLEL